MMKKKNNNTVSSSGLDLFDSCPRAYYYRYEEGIERADKVSSQALIYGTLFHEFLEKHHRNLPYEKTVVTDDTIDKQMFIMLNEQIDAYIKNRPKEKFKFLMVEQPFSGKFVDPKTGRKTAFTLSGIIDGLVVSSEGEYWLWENKTTSRADQAYIDRIYIDRQTHIYKKKVEELFKKELNGQQIVGVIYNIIQKPKVEWSQGETVEEFIERQKTAQRPNMLKRKWPDTVETYTQKVRAHIKPEHFLLITKYFSDEKVAETLLDIADVFKNIKSCRRTGYWRKCTKSCHKYNSQCEFFPLCLSDNQEYLKQELYQQRTRIKIEQPKQSEEIF